MSSPKPNGDPPASMANEQQTESGSANNRRLPNNWEGILKFCIESTKADDRTGPTQLEPMSAERKQWLKEALEASLGRDSVKQMVEDIQLLTEPGETDDDLERKENALEDLHMLCEDIDLAQDFCKIGGYGLLSGLLSHRLPMFRRYSADILATLVQNNPYCQQAALDSNLLSTLMEIVDKDNDEMVRVKAMYAISCLTRNYSPAQEKFVSLDGFSLLIRVMQSSVEKLEVKAAFLLGSLLVEESKFKDVVCDMGMVEQLIALLHGRNDATREQLMVALVRLVEDHSRAIQECRRPEFGLKAALEARGKEINGRTEYTEEIESIRQLLKICFESDKNNDRVSVDR